MSMRQPMRKHWQRAPINLSRSSRLNLQLLTEKLIGKNFCSSTAARNSRKFLKGQSRRNPKRQKSVDMENALRKYLPGGVFVDVTARASRNLSAVRGRNNRTTEVRLKLALVRASICGWRLHPSGILGNPDFLFVRQKL